MPTHSSLETVNSPFLDAGEQVRQNYAPATRFSRLAAGVVLAWGIVQPPSFEIPPGIIECPEVSQEVVRDTEEWLAKPLRYDVEHLMKEEAAARAITLPIYRPEMTPEDSKVWHDVNKVSIRKYKQALAKANNLTIFEPEDTYAKLFPGEPRKLTGEEEFAFTREFISQYGVTLESTDADLTTASASALMSHIRDAFAQVPREFIEYAKVNRMAFDRGGRFGAAHILMGVITFDITSKAHQTTRDVMHEFFHLWDRQSCGLLFAQDNDPGFSAIRGGRDRTQGLSEDNYYLYIQSLEAGLETALKANDLKEACNIHDELTRLGAQTLTPTEYSRISDDDSEEKADLSRAFIDHQLHHRYLKPYSPVIKQEYTYLYARLRKEDPAVANYFLGMTAVVRERADAPVC